MFVASMSNSSLIFSGALILPSRNREMLGGEVGSHCHWRRWSRKFWYASARF